MALAVSRFAWEDVAEQQGVWHHTEYTIELCLGLASAGEGAAEAGAGGARWTIRRRYSDFEACQAALLKHCARGLPELPPKEPWLQRALGSFAARLAWQEQRRAALLAYVEALLGRLDLHAEPCVQRLLALGPARLLTAQPAAPASVRVRPVRPRAPEEAVGPHPGTVEVVVQQATAGSLDEEAAASQLPVAEIVVVFREVFSEGGGAESQEDVERQDEACRLHLPVESLTSEACAEVALTPGQAYMVEAYSVSVTGLESPPIMVSALVPPSESPPHPADQDVADAEDPEAGDVSAGARQRREAAAWRLRRTTFRGHAAAEYIAAASEKVRQSYAKAPYRLMPAEPVAEAAAPGRSRADSSRQHVQVEVEQADLARAAAEERTVHRDAQLLDSERTSIQRQRRLEEARAVASWMADLVGRAELGGGHESPGDGADSGAAKGADEDVDEGADEGAGEGADACAGEGAEEDLASLRTALISGEVLCELVNAAAARGTEGAAAESLPVPFYHRNPSTRFRSLENVSLFLGACRGFFGMSEHQLFCTGDIAGGRDMQAVVQCLLALGARIHGMYPAVPGPAAAALDRPAPSSPPRRSCDHERPSA